MGSILSLINNTSSKADTNMALEKVKQLVASTPVIIFRKKTSNWEGDPPGELVVPQTHTGERVEYIRELNNTGRKFHFALSVTQQQSAYNKTTCGFCNRVKELLKQLGASFQVMELDQESDGNAIQAALQEWTGQRTVPNVFIGGKHIGGCDAVMEKHSKSQLVPLLVNAKAIAAEQTA